MARRFLGILFCIKEDTKGSSRAELKAFKDQLVFAARSKSWNSKFQRKTSIFSCQAVVTSVVLCRNFSSRKIWKHFHVKFCHLYPDFVRNISHFHFDVGKFVWICVSLIHFYILCRKNYMISTLCICLSASALYVITYIWIWMAHFFIFSHSFIWLLPSGLPSGWPVSSPTFKICLLIQKRLLFECHF